MNRTVHEERAQAAEAAVRGLGPSPNRHRSLAVHCSRSHHVASVYSTPGGQVYTARPWAHGHGDQDRHDAAHHGGHRDAVWADWLDPGDPSLVEDGLPAGCECGPRSLSRAVLRDALAAGTRRLVVP